MIALFLSAAVASSGPHWTKEDRDSYAKRHFVVLEQRLINRGSSRLAFQISKQEDDLKGCREVHDGKGNVASLAECIRFLNKEGELGLASPGSTLMAEDLNLICERLLTTPESVNRFLEGNILINRKRWTRCVTAAWRQIFYFAYANIESNPIKTVSLVRKAQNAFAFDPVWTPKTLHLIREVAPNGP